MGVKGKGKGMRLFESISSCLFVVYMRWGGGWWVVGTVIGGREEKRDPGAERGGR